MKLILHRPDEICNLPESYRRAFSSSKELLIVSAYLTHWDKEVLLNPACERFRMIVGKDFGITRKLACEAVLEWLPRRHKVHFRVADQIMGFHPKAVFWREADGKSYAIIGSSNLSVAAFESNYEANIEIEISATEYERTRNWVDHIAELSVPVSKDWLANYREAPVGGNGAKGSPKKVGMPTVFPIKLPRPKGSTAAVRVRREVLKQHRRNRKGIIDLFRQCANGDINSSDFYQNLSEQWGGEAGGRLQGNGWERSGKNSDLKKLSESFVMSSLSRI